MSIQCVATLRNGSQCKNKAQSPATLCRAHKDYAGHVFAGDRIDVRQDAPETPQDAPIIPVLSNPLDNAQAQQDAAQNAPIIPASVVINKEAQQRRDSKDNARMAFERRQNRARMAISAAPINLQQKEAARMLLNKADDGRAVVSVNVKEDDGTIIGFEALLRSGDAHAQRIRPATYDTRPRWLGEKDWNRAKSAFNRSYNKVGASSFEYDSDGRLIMPLPMTAARYMGMVAQADAVNVLRYASAFDKGEYTTLAAMDHVAPVVASLLRTASSFNASIAKLEKAQAMLDSAPSTKHDARTKARDKAREERNTARESFVESYMVALDSMAGTTEAAREAHADMLTALAAESVA